MKNNVVQDKMSSQQTYCVWDPNAGCVCDADSRTGVGDRQCNPYGDNQDADCCSYDAAACSNSKLNTKANWNYCSPMAGATALKNVVYVPRSLPKSVMGIL